MKRWGHLFETVVARDNLWRGWREFRRGKRGRSSVRAFERTADRHVMRLGRELAVGEYRPGELRLIGLHEPKRRLIAAAPVHDRVVHHAVHRVLAPRFDPHLIHTTYACLPGRGSHRAVLAHLAALRRYRHVLGLDNRHYFLSVDRGILLELMARHLKDPALLELLRTIADSGDGLYRRPDVAAFLGLDPGFPAQGCGLPIGNLTSQWWGNHYLSGLDHFVKRELRIPHYQRYMDDMTLFHDSPAALEDAREAVKEWLWTERRLRLKKPGAQPRPTTQRFTYLGYRVSRSGVRPSRDMLRRMQRRIADRMAKSDVEGVVRSIAAYRGIVNFATTFGDRSVGSD